MYEKLHEGRNTKPQREGGLQQFKFNTDTGQSVGLSRFSVHIHIKLPFQLVWPNENCNSEQYM